LLITHRLANAKRSDKICLLQGGVVFEEGTHSELMALNGSYARLFNEQAHYETAVLA
jgi:ATP-binding cassette subfamily B protein